MSTAKKGFDPLSSLFDVPTPPRVPAAASGEPTDPTAADEPIVAAPVVVDREGEAAPSASTPVAKAPAAPAVDPVQLARMLAKAAAAKAGAPKPVAAAKPAAPAPKPAAPAARAPASKPAAQPEAVGSRAFAAPPPKRALSVEEALAAARAQEAAPKPAPKPVAAPAPAPAAKVVAAPAEPISDLASAVQAILAKAFPGLAGVAVSRANIMDDRGTLLALWKAHRARVAAGGDLVAAVGVVAVIHALGNVGIGKLVAAVVSARGQELLVFVDLGANSVVAAFPDARTWLGGKG